jgi:hypothetical protein
VSPVCALKSVSEAKVLIRLRVPLPAIRARYLRQERRTERAARDASRLSGSAEGTSAGPRAPPEDSQTGLPSGDLALRVRRGSVAPSAAQNRGAIFAGRRAASGLPTPPRPVEMCARVAPFVATLARIDRARPAAGCASNARGLTDRAVRGASDRRERGPRNGERGGTTREPAREGGGWGGSRMRRGRAGPKGAVRLRDAGRSKHRSDHRERGASSKIAAGDFWAPANLRFARQRVPRPQPDGGFPGRRGGTESTRESGELRQRFLERHQEFTRRLRPPRRRAVRVRR